MADHSEIKQLGKIDMNRQKLIELKTVATTAAIDTDIGEPVLYDDGTNQKIFVNVEGKLGYVNLTFVSSTSTSSSSSSSISSSSSSSSSTSQTTT